MAMKLYVIHGSHPCAAVMKALELKGLPCSVVEWPPPLHVPMQLVLFKGRTVPALSIDSEKVTGSHAIFRRLEEIAPNPPLIPADPGARARVQDAERWGEEVFQAVPRELIWPGLVNSPAALVGYSAHSRLRFPAPIVRTLAPAIARLEARLHRTDDAIASRTLGALPAHLDRVDAWIADGTLGDREHPNVADLQILSGIRLLLTIGDARPLIEERPCAEAALALFPQADGELPAGSIIAPR